MTGASATARLFQRLKPGIALFAETGGKNAVIVSATADRDAAIKDVLHSAFGHAGMGGSLGNLLEDPRLNHRVPSTSGVLAEGCGDLLRSFFRDRR